MSGALADELALCFARSGFSWAFGYLGQHIEPFPHALTQAGVRAITAASETGAGFMAHGFAVAGRCPALTYCGGGPALAMLLPALQTAMVERVPLIAVVGQTASTGTSRFQCTEAQGSRDRQVLQALLPDTCHLSTTSDLGPALELAEAAWAASRPFVLTVPQDLMAAPWTGTRLRSLNVPATAPRPPVGILDHCGNPHTGSYREAVAALAEAMPADTVWFGDAGQSRHAMRMELGGRGIPFHDCEASGPMGWAIAASIGAACFDAARPVVCFTGDGSALMLGLEMVTAVKLNSRVTFVLADNGVLGAPYARRLGRDAEAQARLPAVDWIRWAQAIGLPAVRAKDATELRNLAGDQRCKGPRLLVTTTPAWDPTIVPPYELAIKGNPL